MGGDKSNISPSLINALLETGISYAATNYRLTDTAPYPAQMMDCARALQFLRHNAGKWNLDPTRVAASGGSAGAGISLWLCFHEDLADPTSEDPIAQESTRLSCASVSAAQCTYDPREIRKLVPGNAYDHVAMKRLFDLPNDWDWDTGEVTADLDARMKDCAPIQHLSGGDAPVLSIHATEQDVEGNIHHANFGRHLKKLMDSVGVECIQKMDTDFAGPEERIAAVVAFLKRHFGM